MQNNTKTRLNNPAVAFVAAIIVGVLAGILLGFIFSGINVFFAFFAFLASGYIIGRAWNYGTPSRGALCYIIVAIAVAATVLLSQVVYISDAFKLFSDAPYAPSFEAALDYVRSNPDTNGELTRNLIMGFIAAVLGVAAGLLPDGQASQAANAASDNISTPMAPAAQPQAPAAQPQATENKPASGIDDVSSF